MTAAARRGSAQNRTKRLQEESPGKDHTPPSAMAKTTETTTDQTAKTETDRTGKEQVFLLSHLLLSDVSLLILS